MPDDAALLTMELPDRPQAPGAARKALTSLNGSLHLVSEARLRDVQLVVSELVTNAHLHGGSGDALRLAVLATDEVLRVEVHDGGAGFDPLALAELPITAGHGKGLKIVHALSDRWGVDAAGGAVVWFEIDRPQLEKPLRVD